MKEQLTQYVNLLFAGAPGSEDIRQEILQNTLDRYDDLIDQGKSPEAAYRLAISGIGDINEILGAAPSAPIPYSPAPVESDEDNSRKMRAAAIAMYITCPIPLFVLSEFGLETMGLCLLLLLVAAATALLIMAKHRDSEETSTEIPETPKTKLTKSIDKLISIAALAVYLFVSVITEAWVITWLIFPISACVKGIVTAILDLKEANDYEA